MVTCHYLCKEGKSMFAWVQNVAFPMIHKMEEYIHSKSVSLGQKMES